MVRIFMILAIYNGEISVDLYVNDKPWNVDQPANRGWDTKTVW
jgi:hypothetical protein